MPFNYYALLKLQFELIDINLHVLSPCEAIVAKNLGKLSWEINKKMTSIGKSHDLVESQFPEVYFLCGAAEWCT